MRAAIAARQQRAVDDHHRHTTRLAALDTERHKLLDAYYHDATPLDLLETEQARITREAHQIQQQLDAVDADLDQWQQILAIATRFAANCHAAYRAASPTTKRQLNHAVFKRITLRDGHIHRWEFQPPFDVVFEPTRFEYGSCVGPTSHNANRVALLLTCRCIASSTERPTPILIQRVGCHQQSSRTTTMHTFPTSYWLEPNRPTLHQAASQGGSNV